MNINRRTALLATASTLVTGTAPSFAQEQNWPTRPVRLIVPLAPGGATDSIARVLAQAMSGLLPQPVVVENRPGATGNIGAAFVARSAPDGYTLMLGTPGPMVNNQFIYKTMPFNPLRDFRALSLVARVPNVVAVHPSTGFKTIADLLAYARANPGKLNSASAGSGGAGHLSLALFTQTAGVNITHVPYSGAGPALRDLLPGQVQIMVDNLPPLLPFIRDGQLRALAVTTRQRVAELPDVPTVAESLPGYDTSSWFVVVAPSAMPDALADRISTQIQAAVAKPEVQQSLRATISEPVVSGQEEARALLVSETKRWEPVIRSLGMKVD